MADWEDAPKAKDQWESAPPQQEKPFGQKAIEFLEPTAEMLGTVGGGALGAGLGPAGAVGGAGLGYALTRGGIQTAKEMLGYQQPRTPQQLATGTAKDILMGGTFEAGGRALPTILRGLGSGYDFLRSAAGAPTREAAEALRAKTAKQLETPITEAEQKARRAAETISTMERQPGVAAERAARAPLTPAQQTAALQAELRQPVRERAGAAARTAEQQAAQAEKAAESAATRAAGAQQAVAALEQQLMKRPNISAEEFGKQLRKTVEDLYDRLLTARTEGANFKSVIKAAGTEPTINTAPLAKRAFELSQQSRNPTVISMLNEIQALAKTGETNALNLAQADSLRKTLSKDIINKYFAQTGADKETLNTLKELRRLLIKETPPAYKQALAKFSVLSRPLDIMERQGALKRVVDVDALSTAEKLTEAQVVGEIINKARAGNPVFTRLLEQSPGLKDAGRLYFTQDLFAKGAVPTEASLRTWLRNNERPLRQLGLYEEFKSLRLARESANRAVEQAKLGERAAKETARVAGKEAEEAVKVSKLAESRLQEALGTAAMPTQRPGETLAEALRRTRTGEKAAPIQTFVSTREQQRALADSLSQMQSKVITAKTPQEVQQAVTAAANNLRKKGIVDDAGYRTILRDVENLKSLSDAQAQARKVLAYFAGAAGLGYVGRGAVGSFFDAR